MGGNEIAMITAASDASALEVAFSVRTKIPQISRVPHITAGNLTAGISDPHKAMLRGPKTSRPKRISQETSGPLL